jgi:hypothetical protein
MMPTYIRDLARVIIACELSSQPECRGLSADDPRLLELADRYMNDPSTTHRHKVLANDGIKMAWVVHRFYQENLLKLVDAVWNEATQDDSPPTDLAQQLIGRVWVDDTPQYHPRKPRNPR